MKKFLLLGAIALLMGGASEAPAQRRGNDRQRVRQGIRSGQITRAEAQAIRERQRQIREERRTYRSDGVITRDERREIRSDRRDRRRGNGYYRRGAGSSSHPVFGNNNRGRRRY